MEQDHIIIRRGLRSGEMIYLSNTPLIFGRLENADVTIAMTSVSRRHARISRGQGGYIIEDLGSSNGTFVNNQPLTGPRLLVNGDMIGLGPEVQLELSLAVAPSAQPTSYAPQVAGPAGETPYGATLAVDTLAVDKGAVAAA